MVIRKGKKGRKLRGYRVHGWGRTGQHRKSGIRGGFGNAGRKSGKHKFSWILKYNPNYFGKHGFKRPNKIKEKCINLLEISSISSKLLNNGLAKIKDEYIEVDVSKLGYDKVLAGGYLDKKYIIKAKKFSEKALEKIRKLGSMAVIENASS